MSWASTHQWWQAVREAEAEIERRGDGVLPWRPELVGVFGDPDGLIAALRYRWNLTMQAQADELAGADGDAYERALINANRGVLRILQAVDHGDMVAASAATAVAAA
ncbi:hypothetical protein GCM10023094_03120 [Rhodococcus olei]|uniref:Uncharacterized protein n=1 Tax=Rhodococcus olei TaxID=2161675 RepID=A0ABP8NV91_9NOCA